MQLIRLLLLLVFSCGWLTTDALPLRPDLMSPISDGLQQSGNRVEYINFGKLDQWVTRNIKESGIIGGKTKVIYAIGPTQTINGNVAYLGLGGSPWATSNVYAHVAGIHKANLSVWKQQRPGQGYCAKLYTHLEECKVLGIVNIKVLAAGSIFLGQMMEPISGVSNPMSKLNCGVRFNKKPSAIRFDYAVKLSGQPNRIKQTGFGGAKTIAGKDAADCIVYLPVWVRASGNISAPKIDFGMDNVTPANVKEVVKDQVTTVIRNTGVADSILARAQREGERILEAAKKLADKTRDESKARAKQVVDEGEKNGLLAALAAKKAAEVVEKEGEEAARKIESEAQAKIDAILAKAKREAEKAKGN